MKARRVRRNAADAREVILEVAEQQLREAGPAALRLQDVAAAAKMSHPTVLHHFGSRDGLVRAVVERAAASLQADLVRALGGPSPPDGAALFERVAETFASRGHARLIAWLVLSGYDPLDTPVLAAGWDAIAKATHARRGKNKASYEDTRFTIMLSCLALFGQAVAGRAMFRTAGLGGDPAVERRFRAWLAALLERHLD